MITSLNTEIKRPILSDVPSDFSPKDICGLEVWYDAMDANTISLGPGGDVAQWYDKSGKGNHATQSVQSRQPDYVLSSSLSGNPALGFNGVNKFLNANSVANIVTIPHTTFFTFYANLTGGVPGTLFGFFISGGNAGVYFLDQNRLLYFDEISEGFELFSGNEQGKKNIFRLLMYVPKTPNPLSYPYANKQLGNVMNFPAFPEANQFAIGQDWDGPSATNFFSGHIGEILIYRRVLSQLEGLKVEDYLNKKWGIF